MEIHVLLNDSVAQLVMAHIVAFIYWKSHR